MSIDPKKIRILYDLLYLDEQPMNARFRMTGILRVISKWGEKLALRDDVAWSGRISRERTELIAAQTPEFTWLANGLNPIPTLVSRCGIDAAFQKLTMVPFSRRDAVSRGRRFLGFRWRKLAAPKEAGRIIAARARHGGKFIYHLPVTSDLPEVIAPGCIPVMNVYDVVPLVFTDTYPSYTRKRFIMAIESARRLGAHLIVNASSTRHDLVSRFAIDPEKIHVIPLGSDLIGIGNSGSTPERFFLYVCSDAQRRKNIPTAIKAFARFRERNSQGFTLKLVGGGSDALVAEMNRAGIDTRDVEGLGVVDAATLERLYNTAYCGLYLSLYEGFGLPVLESMARGVPMISSNATSLPEVAGDAAILVDPLDADAIAGAMERIVMDPSVRVDLAERGRRRSERFTWDASYMSLENLYRKLLDSPAHE